MIRMSLGIIIGATVAFVTVLVMQEVGHIVFPPAAELDPDDTEAIRTYVSNAPVGALWLVLASYFIGTFDGVFLACLVARMKYHIFGIIVGGLMLAATIANLILIPHPHWFSLAAVLGIAICAVTAVLLAVRTLPERAHP